MSGNSEESGSQPERTRDAIQFNEAETEVLAYLRSSKRVDLRWLTEEQKRKIRTVLDGLHNEKRVSLFRISKEVGRSYTAIWGLCRALEIHTRTVAEADRESAVARSKHKRTPFAGTENDRGYMLGFKNGDLTAWQVSGTSVMVTSSTTHPAFVDLFSHLFGSYSHVYRYPMFEEGKGYKWKVAVRLDNSFRFLLKSAQEAIREFAPTRELFLSWLAGMIDSDGNIHPSQDNGYARVRVTVYNSDKALLYSIIEESRKIGYQFDGPYLLKEKDTVTPYGIRYTKDLWQIAIQQTSAAQRLLTELPVRHVEKLERKRLAAFVGQREWSEISAELERSNERKRVDVLDFCREAEETYKQKHKPGTP